MSSKTKAVLFSSALTLLGVFGFTAVPSVAHAEQATDCTKGCVIYTCDDGGDCDVWYCSGATGCDPVGKFTRPSAKSMSSRNRVGFNQILDDVAFAKVCSRKDSCDLYQLSHNKSLLIGTFDNIDGIVERLKNTRTGSGSPSLR